MNNFAAPSILFPSAGTNGPISARLPLNGFSHTGLALPDPWGWLQPGQVVVVRREEVFVGKAGLKRGDVHFTFAMMASFFFQLQSLSCHPAALIGSRVALPCHPPVGHLCVGCRPIATLRHTRG